MAPDLLTIDAAARMLTVSAATVRRLVRAGRLRGIADLVSARNLRAKQGAKGAQQAPVTRETLPEISAK